MNDPKNPRPINEYIRLYQREHDSPSASITVHFFDHASVASFGERRCAMDDDVR